MILVNTFGLDLCTSKSVLVKARALLLYHVVLDVAKTRRITKHCTDPAVLSANQGHGMEGLLHETGQNKLAIYTIPVSKKLQVTLTTRVLHVTLVVTLC